MLPIDKIVEEYQQGISARDLSEKYNTYIVKIISLLKKYVKIRSKGEQQKLDYKNNKRPHPTKGKPRTEEDKEKISKGMKNE